MRHADVPADLYPFEGKTLDRSGLRYHYLDEGQGEPVVMLHGNPTWSFYYRELVLALRDRYRTVVPDHIGMGFSDKPADSEYNYCLESRVDDLAALLDTLGIDSNVTLVMHDWGGMIGMAYASRHPERIARLVLLNTAAFHLPASLRLPLALRLVRTGLGAASVRGLNAFSRVAGHVCCVRRPLSPRLRRAYRAPYDSWANRIATLRFVQDIPLGEEDPSYRQVSEVEASLPRFQNTPTLICWGERDFVFTTRVLEEWQRRWPHARVHRFRDSGHFVLEDSAEQICSLVRDFLAAHPVNGGVREVAPESAEPPVPTVNIAESLARMARIKPDAIAICHPLRSQAGKIEYQRINYRELDLESDRLARGLARVGITRGTRTLLMVPPGPEFFALAFGLAKAGAVPVVIDPGMARSSLGACLSEAEPEAFIGVAKSHAARLVLGWGRDTLRVLVTVGGWSPFGGIRLETIERAGGAEGAPPPCAPGPSDLAALLFTSGSTGLPKAVEYTHRHFAAQIEGLHQIAALGEQEVDLPTFPLFALFGPALGMTTVVPQMDFRRPARVDPVRIVAAIRQEGVTNMFASVAVLDVLGRFGQAHKETLPSLRRVVCAGAPVPIKVLERFVSMLGPGARVLTPYGATEALPITCIDSGEILGETRFATEAGAGVCVGRPVQGVEIAIIDISEEPVLAWREGLRLPAGQVGEIVVRGPMVTERYWRREQATRLAKIPSHDGFFHRMGDVGYLDAGGRLWFCGRKSQRVVLAGGSTLFTIQCEGVFNVHPLVRRSALVGVARGEAVEPVLCVELEVERQRLSRPTLIEELRSLGQCHAHTASIQTFLVHGGFPVDTRHNAKIRREELASWATRKLA